MTARKNNKKRTQRGVRTEFHRQKEGALQKSLFEIIGLSSFDGIMSYPFGVRQPDTFPDYPHPIFYGENALMRKSVDLGNFGEYLHYGMPLALVAVLEDDGSVNVSTVASMTPLPGEPSRLVMGVFEENFSSELLKKRGEFTVNFITSKMRSVARACGSYSGKDVDKFEICDLHTLPAQRVSAPLIQECPLNIECRITDVLELDGLNLFVSEIIALEVDESLSDGRDGVLVEKLDLLFYAFGHTFARGPMVGHGSI